MSEASKLIERLEAETGQRFDSNDGDNFTMAGLFGALARAMGDSSHQERDDVAAGVVMRHRMTPEYEQQQHAKHMLGEMLVNGMSPDDIHKLAGK
ncbi:MAG: hypothetical protein ACR2P4_07560 [Gammaproteobacteria bacterium]